MYWLGTSQLRGYVIATGALLPDIPSMKMIPRRRHILMNQVADVPTVLFRLFGLLGEAGHSESSSTEASAHR